MTESAYDDTGQPWRHRAESAESRLASAVDQLNNCEARVTFRERELEKANRRATLIEHELDEARATIDRARTRVREVLNKAKVEVIHWPADIDPEPSITVGDHSYVDNDFWRDLLVAIDDPRLRRVLDGDQEDG